METFSDIVDIIEYGARRDDLPITALHMMEMESQCIMYADEDFVWIEFSLTSN